MFHNIIEDVECVFDKSRSHVDFDAVATVADGDATALVFEQSELRASRCRSTRSTVSDTGHKALCSVSSFIATLHTNGMTIGYLAKYPS